MSRLFCISVKVFCFPFLCTKNLPQKVLVLWKIAQKTACGNPQAVGLQAISEASLHHRSRWSGRWDSHDCKRGISNRRTPARCGSSWAPTPTSSIQGRCEMVGTGVLTCPFFVACGDAGRRGRRPLRFYSKSVRDCRGRHPRRPFFALRVHLIRPRYRSATFPSRGRQGSS